MLGLGLAVHALDPGAVAGGRRPVLGQAPPVADLFGYRVQSPPGGFTFALGPLFEVFGFETGDRFPAVVDGYWILLRPPSPGAHTLSFRVDFGADGTDDLGADYQLFIAGPDD